MSPTRPRQLAAAALAVFAVLGAAQLAAHDFWIEPSRYAAAPGEPLALRLRVGEAFAGEALPRDPAHLARFTAVGPQAELAVSGADGADPAGFLLAPAGAWVVVYGSHPGELRLDGAKFARYLQEEGLESVQLERERRGESGAPARERFSRYAKSLVRLGGEGDGAVFARPVGLALELVPEGDPTRPPGSGELAFRLLHAGEPLAGARVAAVSGRRPAERLAARTDASGRVRLPIAHAGPWLITSVHMVPAPAGSGADWESLWASLTFEVSE